MDANIIITAIFLIIFFISRFLLFKYLDMLIEKGGIQTQKERLILVLLPVIVMGSWVSTLFFLFSTIINLLYIRS